MAHRPSPGLGRPGRQPRNGPHHGQGGEPIGEPRQALGGRGHPGAAPFFSSRALSARVHDTRGKSTGDGWLLGFRVLEEASVCKGQSADLVAFLPVCHRSSGSFGRAEDWKRRQETKGVLTIFMFQSSPAKFKKTTGGSQRAASAAAGPGRVTVLQEGGLLSP